MISSLVTRWLCVAYAVSRWRAGAALPLLASVPLCNSRCSSVPCAHRKSPLLQRGGMLRHYLAGFAAR